MFIDRKEGIDFPYVARAITWAFIDLYLIWHIHFDFPKAQKIIFARISYFKLAEGKILVAC